MRYAGPVCLRQRHSFLLSSSAPANCVDFLARTVVDPGGPSLPADINLTNRESGFNQTRKSNAKGIQLHSDPRANNSQE